VPEPRKGRLHGQAVVASVTSAQHARPFQGTLRARVLNVRRHS
jgi:hypothetical protein